MLVLLLVAFTGCDTNNGGSRALGDLEGVYALEELRFAPNAGGLAEADLAARLLADGTARRFTWEMDVKSVITSPSPQAPIRHGRGRTVVTGHGLRPTVVAAHAGDVVSID